MKVEKNIISLVDRALASTEGKHRLNANPFLMTRIESTLRYSNNKTIHANKPAISMLAVIVVLMVLINGTLVALNYQQQVAISTNHFQPALNNEMDNQVNYEY